MASLYDTGVNVLYIMRGCPGSGKSTLATELKGRNGKIFSTDDFFVQSDGEYVFDPKKVAVYHKRNQERAREAISEGVSPVVIDNTNTTFWEMRPYVETGLRHGYKIEFVEPSTSWRYDPDQLCLRNSHGVNVETIKRMLKRFQKNPTVDKIIGKRARKLSNECQKVLVREAPQLANSDISDISCNLATSKECEPDFIVPVSNSFSILTETTNVDNQFVPQEILEIENPVSLTNVPQGHTNVPQGYTNVPQGYTNVPQGYTNVPQGYTNVPQGYTDVPLEPIEVKSKPCGDIFDISFVDLLVLIENSFQSKNQEFQFSSKTQILSKEPVSYI